MEPKAIGVTEAQKIATQVLKTAKLAATEVLEEANKNRTSVSLKTHLTITFGLLAIIGPLLLIIFNLHVASDSQQFSAEANSMQQTASILSSINDKIDKLQIQVTEVQTTQNVINKKIP